MSRRLAWAPDYTLKKRWFFKGSLVKVKGLFKTVLYRTMSCLNGEVVLQIDGVTYRTFLKMVLYNTKKGSSIVISLTLLQNPFWCYIEPYPTFSIWPSLTTPLQPPGIP